MPRKVPEEVAKHEVSQSSLAHMILRHWQEHRPKMCADLEKANTLYQSVWAVAKRTASIMVRLTHEGMQYDQMEEIARKEWQFPDEEDQPDLTFDPKTHRPA